MTRRDENYSVAASGHGQGGTFYVPYVFFLPNVYIIYFEDIPELSGDES